MCDRQKLEHEVGYFKSKVFIDINEANTRMVLYYIDLERTKSKVDLSGFESWTLSAECSITRYHVRRPKYSLTVNIRIYNHLGIFHMMLSESRECNLY